MLVFVQYDNIAFAITFVFNFPLTQLASEKIEDFQNLCVCVLNMIAAMYGFYNRSDVFQVFVLLVQHSPAISSAAPSHAGAPRFSDPAACPDVHQSQRRLSTLHGDLSG